MVRASWVLPIEWLRNASRKLQGTAGFLRAVEESSVAFPQGGIEIFMRVPRHEGVKFDLLVHKDLSHQPGNTVLTPLLLSFSNPSKE